MTTITSENVQSALFIITTFFAKKESSVQSATFRLRLTIPETQWRGEDIIWQLRTRAPDGSSREAIFPSIEGIIIRCTPLNSLSCVLMCNLVLPWQSCLEQKDQQLTASLLKTHITFVRVSKEEEP